MDFEFHSQEELYKRVLPALHAKEVELHRLGYMKIKALDIWKYLAQTKWQSASGLMLSDIVSDIINAECRDIYSFWNSEVKNQDKDDVLEDREVFRGE